MSAQRCVQLSLFDDDTAETKEDDIRVIELFAGVGGFRIGLERASAKFKTVWNNQWEPSTKKQDASIVYCHRFGCVGHSNEDIAMVPVEEIPDADLLCGGFPCQDYSVATTLVNSKGIEGKKGVLWWQIQRILRDKGENAPKYLILENVDRLLCSPPNREEGTLPSYWHHCLIWDIVLNGELSMRLNTECRREGKGHISLLITIVLTLHHYGNKTERSHTIG